MNKDHFKKKEDKKEDKIKDALSSWYLGESEEKVELKQQGTEIVREAFLKVSIAKATDSKTKYTDRWVCLVSGALYFYKTQFDAKHFAWLKLRGSKIMQLEKGGQRVIEIENGEKIATLQARDQDLHIKWLMDIKGQTSKNPTQPPVRIIAKKKGKLFSAGKHLSEKAALTQTGKKLLLSYVPPEIVEILENLHKLFEQLSFSQKKAEQYYGDVIKLVIKTLLLLKSKHIEEKEFESSQIPALCVWSIILDMDEFESKRDPTPLSKTLKELEKHLVKILQPHLTPKSINERLKPLFELFSNPETINKVFSEDKKEMFELRSSMCNSLRKVWDTKISKATKKKIETSKLIN